MRKLFFCLFLFVSSLASAQLDDFQDVRFGFQISPAFSRMSSNATLISPTGTNLGLKVGLLGEFFFRDNYALSTGLGFAFNHGGTLLSEYSGYYWQKSDYEAMGDSLSGDIRLKYGVQFLEIPVGLKMRTREFGYLRYFLEPGVVMGFKTKAIGKITAAGATEEEINIRKEVNGLNLSWGINGGIEYGLSDNTSLIAGLGVQLGFSDVTDDKGSRIYNARTGKSEREDSKGVMRAIVLKMGILF